MFEARFDALFEAWRREAEKIYKIIKFMFQSALNCCRRRIENRSERNKKLILCYCWKKFLFL